jgi:arylsulfatase A-like enzyme
VKKKPNVLMIVTDQQRADTIHALGNDVIRTPALDALAKEGTSFRRAYTPCPVCSPTRVAMATGLPPHVHRFTDHDWWHWEDPDGPKTKAPHDKAFMEVLHEAGYQTFMTGKLHFHGRGWLTDGVEEYAGREAQLSPKTKRLQSYAEFTAEKGYPPYNNPWGSSGEYYMVPQITDAPPEHTNAHFLADQSIDFLQRRDKSKPFMLSCHFPGPHAPVRNPFPWAMLYRTGEIDPPHRPENWKEYQSRTNRYQNRYKGKETAQEDDIGYRIFKSAYYADISFIDYNIGRIIEALGDEKDNTLILFTCDHGEMLGDYGCVGKRCMLEGSIRIPFIAVWAGQIPAGKECRTPVSLLDVFPTIQEILGLDTPKPSQEGRSLLQTASEPDGERIVFSQFSSGWCGQYGATDGKWKYAYSAPDDKEWLFRVSDELVEGANLIDDPSAEAREALEKLKGALLARHDPSVDPWSDAVEDGRWKKHQTPPEKIDDDPTYGYHYNCPGEKQLQEAIDALGPYARQVTGYRHGNLHSDHAVLQGQCPFELEDE